jgi:hypothetical protein
MSNLRIRAVPGDRSELLIVDFFDDCALAELSPRTLTWYANNLRRYY